MPSRQSSRCLTRTEAIRSELIKGELSGEPEPFDADLFKEEMVAKYVGRTP